MGKIKLYKIKFFIKIKIILLALFTPIIIYLSNQNLESLSECWNTNFRYLFILTNILTSILFLLTPNWRLSPCFLLLLTFIPVTNFRIIHNIFAISFFTYNVFPILSFKRYNYFFLLYVLSLLWLPNLFLAEIHAIFVLCIYHTLIITKIFILKK